MVDLLMRMCDKGWIPLSVWRIAYRLRRYTQPYVVVSSGTDCDGMRYGGLDYYWTKWDAESSTEEAVQWADGPMYTEVYFLPNPFYQGRRREYERRVHGWADDRDRYAEQAGY